MLFSCCLCVSICVLFFVSVVVVMSSSLSPSKKNHNNKKKQEWIESPVARSYCGRIKAPIKFISLDPSILHRTTVQSAHRMLRFVFSMFVVVYCSFCFYFLWFFFLPRHGLWQHKENEMRHHCHVTLLRCMCLYVEYCISVSRIALLAVAVLFWHTLPNEPSAFGSHSIYISLYYSVWKIIISFSKAFLFHHISLALRPLAIKIHVTSFAAYQIWRRRRRHRRRRKKIVS